MKRLPNENKYQLDIKDQFKNEFEIGQLQGNNFHMTDSADLPMLIEPQGNIEQEVIEAVEGIVVEGSSINVNDVDTSYEDSIMPKGNIEQVVVEEIPGNTIEGEIINITNGDSTKEVKAIVNGNSYQETITEEVGTTVEGSSIHVTDVNLNYETKVLPKGNISQETSTQGNNLLDLTKYVENTNTQMRFANMQTNSVDITVDANATAWSNKNIDITPLFEKYGAGDYHFSVKVDSTSGTNSETSSTRQYGIFGIQIRNKSDNVATNKYEIPLENAEATYSYKITLSSVDADIYNYLLVFYPTANTTLIDAATFKYKEICIAKESSFSGYAEFVPDMPSMNYPSEVKGVSGHYDSYISDNFFDNVFRQGSFSEVGRTNRLFSTQALKLEMGKSYSILTNLDLSKYKYAVALGNVKFPTTSIAFDSGWITQGTFNFTTTTEGYFGIGIARLDDKALTPSHLENVYFEVVTKYQQKPIDIPTGQVWYSGKPYKKDGKWYRPIEFLKVILDGTETIRVQGTGTENWFYNMSFKNNADKFPNGVQNSIENSLYCNMYKKATVATTSTEKGIAIYTTEIRIREEVEDTADNFKARLAELYANGTPVYVVYKLATPIVEEITDAHLIGQLEALQNAELYEGVTNINSYKISDDVAEMPLEAHYNFITPSPSVERPSDIEVIEGVNRFDGEIELGNIVNGANATHTEVYRSKNYIKVKPNTPYAFSLNGKLNRVIICMYDKDKNYIGLDEVGLQVTNGLFTTYANAEYLRFRSYGADVVIIQTAKIQLNEGSTVKLYLPYGHIGLLQRNQQLYDYTKPVTVSSQGVTVDDDGWVTMNYDNTSGTSTVFLNYFSRKLYGIKNSTKYAVVIEIKNVSGNASLVVASSDANVGQFKWQGYELTTLANNSIKIGTLTSVDNLENLTSSVGLRTYMHIQAGKTANMTFRLSVMRNLDVTAETFKYEEYKENLIPINLNGNTLAKAGDIKDLLNIGIDGKVELPKKLGMYIFTGDETFTLYSSNPNRWVWNKMWNAINLKNSTPNAICSHYIYRQSGLGTYFTTGSSYAIQFYDNSFETAEQLKAFLKEQYDNGTPVTVLYELAKAETINLPSISPIKLFEGTNNFELVTNLDTTINMTYNHVGYSPSIVKPSEVKGVGSEEHINMVDVQVVSNKTYTNVIETNPNCIIVEQTSATKLSNIRSNALELKAGVTYTVRRKFEVLSDYSDKDTGNVEIYLGEKWKKVILYPDVEVATFTVDEDGTYYLMHKLAQTNVATATIPIRMKIYDVMVCEGKDKQYTPYGYCRYENVVENKNIFNKEKNYGIGPYYYDNKTKLVSIRTNSSTYTNYRTYNLKLKPNTTYSATLKNLPFNDSNDLHRIMLTNNNDILQKIVVDNQYVPKGIEQIYTFNTGTENLKLWLQTTADIDVVEKIQLEIGEPTEYIEHQSQILPIDIPVGQEWYSGKPYKLNGKWYRDVEWKKEEILTVNSVTSVYTNTARFKTYIPAKYVRGVNPYCNYLIGDNTLAGQDIENVGIHNAGYVQITLSKELFGETILSANTKLQELKDNENPLYVIYPLTEPTREEIIDETLIQQLEALQNAEFYDGVTNINSYRSSEDVAEMPLEAHYNFITPSPSIDRSSEVLQVGSDEDINLYKLNPIAKSFNGGSNNALTIVNTAMITTNSYDDNSVNYTTNASGYFGFLSEPISLKKDEIITVTGFSKGSTSLRGRVIKLNDDGTYLSLYGGLISTQNISIKYSATEDMTIVIGFWTNGDAKYTIELSNLMVTKESNVRFTPYGYCRYENKVKNKNILELPEFTQTQNGVTLTYNKGVVTLKGTTIEDKTYFFYNHKVASVEAGKTYYFDRDRKNLDSHIQIFLGKNIGAFGTEPTFMTNISKKAITTDGDLYLLIYMQQGIGAGTNIDVTFQPQLAISEVATEIVDNLTQTFPIDLPIGMKMYNDEFFYKENGKWWRSINYVKSKLTSDMEWYLEVFDGIGRPRTEDFANIIKNVSAVNTVRVYSNYFKQNYGRTDYVFGNLKVGYLGFYTNKQLYLTTYFKNVNDWKTYLDQNDVYIVFEIEPYPEEITDANLIAQLEKTLTPFSYYPVTNINSYRPTTSVADLKLYVEYFKSNKITNK